MNASVVRNANQTHHHMNTIWRMHSILGSMELPFHRSHFRQELQVSNAFHYRIHGRRTKKMEFSVPVGSFSSNNKGTTVLASITNSGVIGWYLGMIETRPILTKSITSALIHIAADITSQIMTCSSSEPYDVIRTCRMAGYGMIILGPSLHFWFNFVSKILPKQDVITTITKIFIGQAIYGPVITALYFSINAALQGEKGEEIVARLKRDMWPTMISNVLYWPICDFITFRFAPLHLQPLVSNLFSYVWTIYITCMANLAKAGAKS